MSRVASQFEAWCPEDGVPAVLIRWLLTEWCNYRCPYCPQTHERRAGKGDGMTAHAFDNFPVNAWIEAFNRHFAGKRLSLVLTGGEAMVDRVNMTILLNAISSNPLTQSIRIDTNAWWRPDQFAQVDSSKIILMCTFHPSQTDEESFLERLRTYRLAGYKIGMVNYVMDRTNIAEFRDRHSKFAVEGFWLHPNPLWQADGSYLDEDLILMRTFLPQRDFAFRSGLESPKGIPCLFPSISYEMDYKGNINPGCLSESGSFFGDHLPAPPQPDLLCPHAKCVCLDKYSFLKGFERNSTTNPLDLYSRELAAIAKK